MFVRVIPNARRSELVSSTGGELRLRVAAPAVDGRANAELTRTVARILGVRVAAVEVIRGDRSRTKTVRVRGLEAAPALDQATGNA